MKLAPALAALAIIGSLVGCGRHDTGREGAPGSPARDSLIHAIAPELEEWIAMWRTALPGFTVDSLSGGKLEEWRPIEARSTGGLVHRYESSDLTFQILGLPSPDGRMILDLDSYQIVTPGESTVMVEGEPDCRSVLLNRASGTEIVLIQCGTSCGTHWGRWLSQERFALGTWTEADDQGQRKRGNLSIYDLRDSTIASYVTRDVPDSVYERYAAAWKQWLLKRYRETRPRT